MIYIDISITNYIIYRCKEVSMAHSTVNINFRMDSELKSSLEQVCQELGLTLTSAFTIFATKVAREKRIPFEVAVDPFYSEKNMARLRKSIEQMEATGGTIHEVALDES